MYVCGGGGAVAEEHCRRYLPHYSTVVFRADRILSSGGAFFEGNTNKYQTPYNGSYTFYRKSTLTLKPCHQNQQRFHFIHKTNKQALEIVGDEQLSVVAREALPTNTKTSKKAVELMGSTKVVTEKKALKRLGSEMSDSMRNLQIKMERKEKREEEHRQANSTSAAPDLGGEGGGGATGATDGLEKALSPTSSMANLRAGSPNSFTSSPMARRATRLLTEVPKFISEMGMGGGGSKQDLSK